MARSVFAPPGVELVHVGVAAVRLAVLRIVPLAPQAYATLPLPVLGTLTPNRSAAEGLVWGTHEAPPSSVRRIVPVAPTARPIEPLFEKSTALSWTSGSPPTGGARSQVAPPSAVRRII